MDEVYEMLDNGLRIFLAGVVLQDGFLVVMGADLAGRAMCLMKETLR